MNLMDKLNAQKAAEEGQMPDAAMEGQNTQQPLSTVSAVDGWPRQYVALRLHQIVLRSGRVVKPVNGVFTPTSEEEEELLEYYLEQNLGLVDRLKETPEQED